ncbi:MAG TPA: MG2 domain-containing protein, partial [Puia sp.]|nr:MG2 domain-containing protein [Puia sp.]
MNLYKRVLALSCCSVLFYLLPCCVNAQTSAAMYEAKWKTVDSLSGKAGLTESALAAVKRIYDLARQEKNDAQLIRALIYRRDLRSMNSQDDIDSTIAELEKEVAAARQPVRSVLQNILAYEYWSYFQRNRYKFYNRTNTGGPVSRDIGTWTIDDLHRKIEELYLASLKEEKLLQSIKLASFEPILIKGNSRGLRPTLFDLLAHEALEYFTMGESEINQAARVFEIDDPAAFSDAGDFARHVFATDDSLSSQYQALRLFQRLIRFHLADPAPDALIDLDIERIDFVYAHYTLENREKDYRQAIVRVTERYGALPAAAQAWFRLALFYRAKASADARPQENDKAVADSAARTGNIRALAICEKVLEEKDSSEGWINCSNLRREILAPHLQLQTEQVNLPNRPFRSRVSWSNFDRLYLRIIRIDSLEKRMSYFPMWDDASWSKLLSLPVYRSSMQALPPTSDHRTHSVEIAIASLPAGSYVLLAADNPLWNLANGVISIQYVNVSSIAFIDLGRDYFVLNRESGQPIPGATAQVWQRKYNNRTNSSDWGKKESYQTDAQGHFLIREGRDADYNARSLDISVGGDHLFLPEAALPFFAPEVNNDKSVEKEAFEKKYAHTFFFLDRSIYRPGQTLYFKGIVITQDADTRKPKVFPDRGATIYLYNVNGEKLDSVEVTTNAFGSYHGTFHLPVNTLNGKFHIGEKTTGENQYFSVEEYKRPKFFVDYEKQKGSYRLGDSVLVTGNAKAYAGNAIEGANVRWRVVRNARFPYYWLFWRGGQPSSATQEIAHGEVRTGADGKFLLRFVARPDRAIDPTSYPEFTYDVTADVTDINGETRSGTTNV